MNRTDLNADCLKLPERPWLARTIEFLPPGIAAIASFFAAATNAGGYTTEQYLTISIFAILATVYFGSGLSGQSLLIKTGVFEIDGLIRSKIVRNAHIQRTESPGAGNVVLVLRGHDDVVLRWSPLGARYWRSNGQLMVPEILRAYGAEEDFEGKALSIETGWIKWRIAYWVGVLVLSPLPVLLGVGFSVLAS